nr:hypothetical protein [Tanacetum cinerariifolium]
IPKRNTQNHNPLPAKSVKARRAANYYRNLYVDISQFVDRSTKSVHTKPHQAKHVMNTSTNVWNATKNTVARIVPIWKPTDSAIARLVPMGYLASFTDEELSKANTHLRTTSLEKIATQKAEIATLKAEAVGKKNSATGTPTKPKVLASGVYTKSLKYIPPQKRADWVQPTLLPKKNQVTFLEPHRTLPRSTQKPPAQHKKPTVPVNMFPKAKPATKARKPIPKRNTQNHNPLPAKSVKARRAADYYRNLYVDISQFVDRSTKSVHTKPHQAKRVVNTSTNVWNATKNTVARIVPIWKPTDSAIARLVPMGYLASFTDEQRTYALFCLHLKGKCFQEQIA